MNDFVRPEHMEVPEGGIASFLTATTGEWAEADVEDMPSAGIANVQSVAEQLADYGRYEDTYMVHAAEGETVVPMAVFEENPRLKESLFLQMRSMGIDPERYIVGNELNSINPVTGQPEFFLKKLFKGLKKAVKKVVKVVKKVAPLVLAVGLSFTPLGAIAGSALGSGIGTLVQGGSLKDALKAGAIGGITAGLFKGIGSKLQGGTFREGIRAGLPDSVRAAQAQAINQASAAQATAALPQPVAPAGSLTAVPGSATATEVATQGIAGAGGVPAQYANVPSVAAVVPKKTTPIIANTVTETVADTVADAAASGVSGQAAQVAADAVEATPQEKLRSVIGVDAIQEPPFDPEKFRRPGFVDSVKDMFVNMEGPGRTDRGFFEAAKDAFFPGEVDIQEYLRRDLGLPPGATTRDIANAGRRSYTSLAKDALVQINKEGLNPNFFRKFGPAAGAGLGILGLTGGFEAPTPEPLEDPFGLGGQSAFDLLQADPNKYRVYGPNPTVYADGGNVQEFPRKTGAIAGPGTGTSDDIPAMLSDGEFVMTAKAVRGAGNGDRKRGVRKMYQMMKSFEGAA